MRLVLPLCLLAALLFATHAPASSVTFDWALIVNAGNAADPQTGYGDVSYDYAISKTEVTNAQYTEFLNAVAATDSFGGADPNLYNTSMGSNSRGGITRSGAPGSYTYAVKADAFGQGPGGTNYAYADKPVNYVSFFDAMRFTNWLHNGQGSGDTETGAYSIGSEPDEVRTLNAIFWVPDEDEWYKAAYHNAAAGTAASYFDYATGTDTVPNNNLPSADTGNSANYFDGGFTTGNFAYPMTNAGDYSLSTSPYGTFDQDGNVSEWSETVNGPSFRILRGGFWGTEPDDLAADNRTNSLNTLERDFIGFRVATLPILTGDFNSDGTVDAADYTVWRDNEGATGLDPWSPGDGDGDGDIDVNDYQVWASHYGMALADVGVGVPEPASALLLSFALLTSGGRRSRGA